MNLEAAEAELSRYLDRAASKVKEDWTGQQQANALELLQVRARREESERRDRELLERNRGEGLT